jgi:predicted patatin/cPLA2 family phospholipase
MKKEEITWIIPGGGNQTAYACGVILALMKLKIDNPKIIIASSGGAANAFYFIANHMKRAKEIWTTEISTKKIPNPFRFWKMFNRDAMIRGVFMKKPGELKLEKISKSQIKCLIGVTDKKSGKVVFFSNKEKINLLNLLEATMSVPFFSGIFREDYALINNQQYQDSRASGRYELLLQKAIDLKAKKIIVLGANLSWNYRFLGNFSYHLLLYTKNKIYRLNQRDLECKQRNFKLPNDINCFYICPKDKLNMAPWDNKKWQLKAAVNQGYSDAINKSEELKKFIDN